MQLIDYALTTEVRVDRSTAASRGPSTGKVEIVAGLIHRASRTTVAAQSTLPDTSLDWSARATSGYRDWAFG